MQMIQVFIAHFNLKKRALKKKSGIPPRIPFEDTHPWLHPNQRKKKNEERKKTKTKSSANPTRSSL
jgi:hypothetical protein